MQDKRHLSWRAFPFFPPPRSRLRPPPRRPAAPTPLLTTARLSPIRGSPNHSPRTTRELPLPRPDALLQHLQTRPPSASRRTDDSLVPPPLFSLATLLAQDARNPRAHLHPSGAPLDPRSPAHRSTSSPGICGHGVGAAARARGHGGSRSRSGSSSSAPPTRTAFADAAVVSLGRREPCGGHPAVRAPARGLGASAPGAHLEERRRGGAR